MENNIKKKRSSPGTLTILAAIVLVIAIASYLVPNVTRASFSDFITSPVKGFADSMSLCFYLFIFGGFLEETKKTGVLEKGIDFLIRKLKGNELILIPILMFVFSIGGTTHGSLEETVGFYAIISAAMVAAGFDTVVSSAVVLLGAGSGTLGSTVNPFAVGTALGALPKGVTANNSIIIGLGTVLWLSTLGISIFFVMRYAKKVKKEKGSTLLSGMEWKNMEEFYGSSSQNEGRKEAINLTFREKISLFIFFITFLIMAAGFIPWQDFGVTFFSGWSKWLTGTEMGTWFFNEASVLFLVMAIIMAFIGRLKEKEITDAFVTGAAGMMNVALVIILARASSVLLEETKLDMWILNHSASLLSGTSPIVFTILAFILYCLLSFVIPSSSGLASVSMPIMGGLADKLGLSVEIVIMVFVAANGLINLFTPTCGAIMGGLALAKVEYTTWLKFAKKIIITIGAVCVVILTVAMQIF